MPEMQTKKYIKDSPEIMLHTAFMTKAEYKFHCCLGYYMYAKYGNNHLLSQLISNCLYNGCSIHDS